MWRIGGCRKKTSTTLQPFHPSLLAYQNDPCPFLRREMWPVKEPEPGCESEERQHKTAKDND